jgi:hypothetical protein
VFSSFESVFEFHIFLGFRVCMWWGLRSALTLKSIIMCQLLLTTLDPFLKSVFTFHFWNDVCVCTCVWCIIACEKVQWCLYYIDIIHSFMSIIFSTLTLSLVLFCCTQLMTTMFHPTPPFFIPTLRGGIKCVIFLSFGYHTQERERELLATCPLTNNMGRWRKLSPPCKAKHAKWTKLIWATFFFAKVHILFLLNKNI